MGQRAACFELHLLGAFRLQEASGRRVDVKSKRGQALLAMLAIAGGGERSRGWLQERLWGSRGPEQARASLRRELSNLRKLINTQAHQLIDADNSRIWLDLALVDVDIRQSPIPSAGDFLEGIDIAGEEFFEDWLRDERARLTNIVAAQNSDPAESVVTPASLAPTPADFSDRPAIAVLPFSADHDSLEFQHIAHGLSEDLIDRLSQLKWLPVIARSSSFALESKQMTVETAGQELRAQYVVEGNLRMVAGSLKLMAMLSDARSGQTLWSNKIAMSDLTDAGAMETLLAEITATLATQVDLQEQVRAQRKPQADLNVNDLIWRGRWHLNRLTKEDFVDAKACFDLALEREPTSPEAIIQSTWVRLWGLWFSRGSDEKIREVRKMAQKAIVADYDDARGHMLAGIAETWLKQPLRSRALLERALELNPSLVLAHAHYGATFFFAGEPEKAIAPLDMAIRLSPNDQQLFYILGERAIANLMLENFGEAAKDADLSIMRRPGYWYAHVIKINALARSGGEAEAEAAQQELRESCPDFKPTFINWLPFPEPSWPRYLAEGLNLSGR